MALPRRSARDAARDAAKDAAKDAARDAAKEAAAKAAAKPTPPHAWQVWCIADGRFEPFSGVGAALVGGRWNSPGLGVIYASRTYAGAMLETLAHAGIGRVPKTHVAIEIRIAGDVTVERLEASSLPSG